MYKDRHERQLQFLCWILVAIPVVSAGIACLANPCLHGICIDDINSTFACYCIDGYTGVQCQTNWDECWSNPCQNGGVCIDGVATYNCSCPDGFIGDNCETNFNECESNPCRNNGTCIDMTNEYICHCIPGFSGEHCELDVAVCNSTEEERCYNGGECIEGLGFKFYCKCSAGWAGTKCEEQIDECQSDPCKNGGICIDVHADYMCACAYGFTGKDCEVQIEFCDEDSCSNNALCVVEDGVRICYCVPDYHGERCELQYDECLLGPRCMNGGTCIDGVDNFTCSCPPRLTGALCECFILDDESYDCEYVSPTLYPVYNGTIVFSTTYSESTTTGSITTIDFTKYNMSTDTGTSEVIPETSTFKTSSDPLTVITSVAITTEKSSTNTEISTTTNISKIDEPNITTMCHCLFNYGGRFCEEEIIIKSAAFDGNSFISHQVRNSTSIAIQFNAKTLITDGQIMHVDIVKGSYMKLFMNFGLLKFEFSCGYQTMLLSELKTYVNKGYLMKIETSYNIVNGEKRDIFRDAFDAAAVTECSSLSCLSSPCLNGGTCSDRGDSYACSCANGWIGNHCNQSVCDHNPCQSGGSCIPHPGSGFLCLCPYGKHGIFCEYNVEITRPSLSPISTGLSTYVMYPLSSAAINSDRFDLRLRFQTADMDQIALLAYVGQSGRHDSKSQHIALTFVKGYIMLTWNMGSGPRRLFTSRALGARRGGHVVRVWRRGRSAGLVVDGRFNVTGNAPAGRSNMTLLPYIYIGGHPSKDFRDLPHDIPLHSGWRGCVWEVAGQAVGAGAVGGRGVGQCGVAQCTAKCICNEGWFGATCAAVHSPCDSSRSQCKGACVITIDDAQCDCPYGRTGINCDQDLVPIDMLFTGTRSYLTLHPRSISSVSLSLEAEIKPMKERGLVIFVKTPHFYTALSLQGGLLEYRWTDHLSGLTSLVRSGVVVSMSQWHNVKAGRYGNRLYVWVDGALSTEPMLAHAYPHTASDASIVIGGAKDLSTLPFDVMSGPPESYSGCLRNFQVNNILLPLEKQNIQDINVTIPQFDGEALLSVSRAPSARSGQRLSSAASTPSRVSLNFTTAEPNGLLLWINMGNDYLGLGLENGYIKLTWSLNCNNSSKQQNTRDYLAIPPKLISSLVQAGFMANGEWHTIVLIFKKHITVTVDQKSYIEEQCYNDLDNEDTDLYIGGIVNEDIEAKKMFPFNFRGCIDKISTKEGTILTNYTEVYTENIQSCQLFPTA
ncbi:protein eyes shut [Vanessa atalanta]|uniref:protein eyes shut n=1 Tax=Vanessa atalanta TaxID=42275 RepID=UPI001FCDB02D|nr:protein eyes shut [Vanessa atalanta]